MIDLYEPSKSYIINYPEAVKFAEQQEGIFWTAKEISVDKDIQDLRVNMTEAEQHGVITTLRLFTLYELFAGADYWLGRVLRRFQKPDIQRMAATNGFFELNVHAPFYNKLNEALMLNTPDFYEGYVKDPVLKDRMAFINSIVDDPDDLVSLGAFTLIEGAVLYSSFAFLKHFQSKGKNKLLNVVRGINFSVRDENLHAMSGAWLYNTLRGQFLATGKAEYRLACENAVERITEASRAIYEHECKIVDMIFEKGPIDGITSQQMKEFVKARINLCLKHLGIDPAFIVYEDVISDWFYDSINTLGFHDFFTGIGNQYNRNWKQDAFKW